MIIKANETVKDAALTVNSVNINYPVTNILKSTLSRIFRTSSSTTAEIVFDCGSAVTVNSIAIANHNISPSVSILKIQGNASNVWTSPSVDEALTWDSDIITKDFTGGSYPYWRIQIIDTTNTDGYIEIGRAGLYNAYSTPNISTTLTVDKTSASVKTITPSGNSFQDSRYFYHTVNTTWPAVTHTEKAEIFEQFEYTDIGIPFFVTFEEDCSDLSTFYGTMEGDSLRATLLQNPAYYTIGFTFREEK